MELGPDSDEMFPDPPSSQLTRWKPLSVSEVQVSDVVNGTVFSIVHPFSSLASCPQATQFASVSIINQQEKTNRFFLTTFQLNEGLPLFR